MTASNQEPYPVKSPTEYWFLGCVFLVSSLTSLWSGLHGETVYLYRGYGAGIPMEPWQNIGAGVVTFFGAIWSLRIAIQRTRLRRKSKSQNKPVDCDM
jgi:hypothetical protein